MKKVLMLFALLCATNYAQEYKTIKLGSQVWMVENLKLKAKNSKCYNNKPANCEKYGGLYEWETAKTICPKGWHLPTDKEWQKLIAFSGGEKKAGKQLKEKTGWAALFGGFFFVSDSEEMPSSFMNIDVIGCWWSASAGNEFEDYSTGNRWFIRSNNEIEDLPDEYGNSCSVRCVKD